MKPFPIINLPNLKDQERLFRGLHDMNCYFSMLDINEDWERWKKFALNHGNSVIYMATINHIFYCDMNDKRWTYSAAKPRWLENIYHYTKVNSINHFLSYTKILKSQ